MEKNWNEFILTCQKLLFLWLLEYQTTNNKQLAMSRIAWLRYMYDKTRKYLEE